jgi:branched-chain amino acid aminotransferase
VLVYLNGEWIDERDARVSVADRGLLFADGVFETARLHRGRFFRLAEHLDRLRESAALFRLALPAEARIAEIAGELARRNALTEATLRVTLTRGARRDAAGTVLVMLRPLPDDWLEKAARGWRVITARTRRPPATVVPPQLKALGRPYSILARLEADDAGADDALMLSADGMVAEGPTWNVFWRTGQRLRTPSVGVGILGGMTRACVIALAPELGLHVEQGAFPIEELYAADEVFATMTSVGLVPLRELDGVAFPAEPAAAIRLQARYWELVATEIAHDRAAP